MYLKLNDRTQQAGLRGFAQASQDEYLKSLDAILKALQINPVQGYVIGSSARKRLEEAFESVPRSSALKLANQLLNKEGPLGRLFRYRLHTTTQQAMLFILARKAKESLQQEKEELRVQEEAVRQRKALHQQLCEMMRKEKLAVDELCKIVGEDSDQCKQHRRKSHEARLQLRAEGVICP